ncbi:hypothetical protein BCR33DRAFT_521037 [Rhizoclosmatium globosum]|uniref:Uncharacterized protein n=1 Tax=Rhizoclosmatium globosum TaxID=329046 RepID=A0A1Y2BEF8_9FUNG|nr:hypothetical protein BCR33DRAFT_521037 [Rhizoclosmatium globosum]|eukprot:ORY33223.1 hypothetical protein BCR33DRAFT_521037 [Rhizoclosmatium globosum]
MNAKWFHQYNIVPANQNEVNWLLLGEAINVGAARVSDQSVNLMKWAIENNLIMVVEVLGFSFEGDMSYSDNEALAVAVEHNYCGMVNLLLQNETVDPTSRNSYGLMKSVENGCVSCVNLIINHEDVDASFDGNICVKSAAKLGRKEVVDYLINSCKKLAGMVEGYKVKYADATKDPDMNLAELIEELCI